MFNIILYVSILVYICVSVIANKMCPVKILCLSLTMVWMRLERSVVDFVLLSLTINLVYVVYHKTHAILNLSTYLYLVYVLNF